MTNYLQSLQQLHQAKQESQSLRKKCLNLESDNTILKQNQQALKSTILNLKTVNKSQEMENQHLKEQREKLVKQYEFALNSIKANIQEKERNINYLQSLVEDANIKAAMLRKQIRDQVQAQFQLVVDKLENQVKQLEAKQSSLSREKDIDKQKSYLKIKHLEQLLEESQRKHLNQIKQYTQRMCAQTQRRVLTSEDNMLKRLRRQLDMARNLLEEKEVQIRRQQREISQLKVKNEQLERRGQQKQVQLVQRMQLQKQIITTKQKIEIYEEGDLKQNKLRIIKLEKEKKKLNDKIKQLELDLEDKDRQLEERKIAMQELNEQLQKVNKKLKEGEKLKTNQLKEENNQLISQIKIQNQELTFYKQKFYSAKQDLVDVQRESNSKKKTNIEKQSLNIQRQENERQQNSVSHISRNKKQNIVNINEQNVTEQINIKNVKRVNKYSNEEEDGKNVNVSIKKKVVNTSKGDDSKRLEIQENDQQQAPKYVSEKVEKQREKVRQIARKYIDLQKKYDKCKCKLEEANQKVLELLREKISFVSPQRQTSKMGVNSPAKTIQAGFKSEEDFRQQGQKRGKKLVLGSEKFETNNNFYRSASPKMGANYYEKSLNFKNKNKVKDLKCLNHDHDNEEECIHKH